MLHVCLLAKRKRDYINSRGGSHLDLKGQLRAGDGKQLRPSRRQNENALPFHCNLLQRSRIYGV